MLTFNLQVRLTVVYDPSTYLSTLSIFLVHNHFRTLGINFFFHVCLAFVLQTRVK